MKQSLIVLIGFLGFVGCVGPDTQQVVSPAQSCTVASTSTGAVITCPDGTSSLVLNGAPGANGQNGANGTVITPIQFCAGIVPSYPSTFPEVGFCINNNIYAVYSANDGFMSLVTPGTYSSDGINASCTFTVLPNCKIQN